MKVLFAQNIAAIAGSEKYFIQLLPALKKKGIEVSFFNFFLPKNKKLATLFSKKLREEGIEVFEVETARYVSITLLKILKNTIQSNNFEILHTHLVYADFLGALLKKLFRLKLTLVSTLHGYQENLYFKYCLTPHKLPKTLYYYIMRFALNQMNGVYACSFGLKNFFDQVGLTPKSCKIEVIHHGFDYPKLNDQKVKEYRKSKTQLTIVGRLIERKGHALILKELKSLLDDFPDLKLFIAGDGEKDEELKQVVKDLGLSEFVDFLGYQEDSLEIMAASDVVLIPSYSEGLPLVIFEAFHSGTPAVAFDTIGCNEAINHKKTGMIANPFDGGEMLKLSKEILSNKPFAKALSIQAKESLKKDFSKNKMVVNTIKFYQRVTSK